MGRERQRWADRLDQARARRSDQAAGRITGAMFSQLAAIRRLADAEGVPIPEARARHFARASETRQGDAT